jgi:xanthine dehydrogenase large subunit
MFHSDNAYFLPESRIYTRRVKTNTVSNTAFRGFGGPQGMMAIERVIDTIAWSLGRDPLDIRKANLYGPGRDLAVVPGGETAMSRGSDRAVGTLIRLSPPAKRRLRLSTPAPDPQARHRAHAGEFGISFTLYPYEPSQRLVHVYQDGSVHLNHGGTEMGQGLFQKVAQVAAENSASGSSVCTSRDLDRQGAEYIGDGGVFWHRSQRRSGAAGRPPDQSATEPFRQRDLERRRGSDLFPHDHVFIGNESIPFGELTRRRTARACIYRRQLLRTQLFWDRDRKGGVPLAAYGAACSEVAIDILTGNGRPARSTSSMTSGARSIRPISARSKAPSCRARAG